MQEGLSKFILYTAANGAVRVDVLLKDETVWLSQKAMSALFECSTDNVSLHLKNIFEINELEENSVTEVFSATASDGKNYNTKHYNIFQKNTKRDNKILKWSNLTTLKHNQL